MTPPSFIDVRNVSFRYDTTSSFTRLLSTSKKNAPTLTNITLQLPADAHVTLFGHEAAGKSTLLRLLTGTLKPTSGTILINGRPPLDTKHLAAGYVSAEESEPPKDTVHQILNTFATTHGVANASQRVTTVSDSLALGPTLHVEARHLSTTQRLRLNLARAAVSDTPVILLDDVADALGPTLIRHLLATLFAGRVVITTTRFAATVDQLDLPVVLLHQGALTHHGTIDELSHDLSCPRIVDIWVEGLRYDLLRQLRKHAGVIEARLLPTSEFAGQRLRVTLHSARYLPTMYDLVSQAPLVRVEEHPASLNDILAKL